MQKQKPLSVLQVCHDTKGPFVGVCRQYAAAFQHQKLSTIFLKGRPDESNQAVLLAEIGGDEIIFLESQISPRSAGLRGLKLSYLFSMFKLFRKGQYDVVIVHRYKALYLISILNLFFPAPKILVVVHEHDMFRRWVRRLFVRFFCKKMLFAGVSDSVSKNIARTCPSLDSEKRLATLYNALDLEQEGEILSRAQAHQQLKIQDRDFVIGTIGRLVKKKNQQVLVRAFAALAMKEASLLLIGDGPLQGKLQLLAEDLGIAEQLIFAGHVDKAGSYIRAIDLFVLPSGKEEGFGIVLLEAMLAKVPIVSTDAQGPKEVVGDTALLFKSDDANDLKDKIESAVAQSGEQRSAQLASAYARLQSRFSYQQFNKRIWEVLGLGSDSNRV